jgi:predicted phage terminase large subunit-like protein
MWRFPNMIGHYVAPTLSDVRGTSFEGAAGLCSVIPAECLKDGSLDKAYNKSTHEIKLKNGSLIRGFGAVEEASRLRGPQCHALAADEIAQWDRPAGNLELAMNNALFGLRLPYPDGSLGRAVMGTTPLSIPFLKRFEKQKGVRIVRGSSYENVDNLNQIYRNQLERLAGTLIGKQEIEGLYIDDESDLSIIKRRWIQLWPRGKPFPTFTYIIEAYDCAASEENYDMKKQTSDPTASIVLGVFDTYKEFSEQERKRRGIKSRFAALLCDAWAQRMGLPELLEKARKQHAIRWGEPPKRSDLVLIEDKSSGPALRQFLVQYGVPTFAYNPGRQSKVNRLHTVSPLINQSMLFVPESYRPGMEAQPIEWATDFLEQVCGYYGPGSTEHDDYVDTLSSAFAVLRDRGMLESMPENTYVDREDKIEKDRREADRVYKKTNLKPIQNPYL